MDLLIFPKVEIVANRTREGNLRVLNQATMEIMKKSRVSLLAILTLLPLVLASSFGFGQHLLFHLLAGGLPSANFSTTSQSVNEADGVWSIWPPGLSPWTKRRAVVLEGVSSSLTDFPVLIKLDSTRIDYGATMANGADLRFTDSSGVLLSHEIERWDSSGSSIVWVKVPNLNAFPDRTWIWMYYGNVSASDAQNATDVWSSGFSGVWNMGSNAADSTSFNRDGVITGYSISDGESGRALMGDGTSGNRVAVPDSITASNVFTLSLRFKANGASGVLYGRTSAAYSTAPAAFDGLLYIGYDGLLRGGASYGAAPSTASTVSLVNDGQWHTATLVANTDTQSLYLDGMLLGTLNGTISAGSPPIFNTIGLGYLSTGWPGVSSSGWQSFNGMIDSVQLSSVARSAYWIEATHLNQSDFLATFLSEESPSDGVAPVLVQLDSAAPQPVTIPYTVSGTATTGLDHNRVSGSLAISSGSTSAALDVQVLRDNLAEANETIVLTLGTPDGVALGNNKVHTITIVDEVLTPPVANDDTIIVTGLSPVFLNVLANDADVNDDHLFITAFTPPGKGTLVRQGRRFLYTPSEDFSAVDSFTYTISDGRGGSDTAVVTLNYQIPFTWIGAGADANWTNGANWLGGIVPGSGDTAYFNDQCVPTCNPILATDPDVGGIRMNSSYPGTLAQPMGVLLTVGSAGWKQRGGIFTGGDSQIRVDGPTELSGGTLTSTSGTWYQYNSSFTKTGGVFHHGSGQLFLTNITFSTLSINLNEILEVWNLRIGGGQGGANTSRSWAIVGGGFNVLNEFRFGRSNAASSGSVFVNGGTIALKGNLVVDPAAQSAGVSNGGGTTVLTLDGTVDQYYSAPSAGSLPELVIDKTSGAVLPLDLTSNSFAVHRFTLNSGAFTAPSGVLGTKQGFTVSAGTTFNHNNGTLSFDNRGHGPNDGTAVIDFPSPLTLRNVVFSGGFTGSSYSWYWDLNGGTINALGDVSIARFQGTGTVRVNNGNVNIAGGLSIGNGSTSQGTALLRLNGAGAQSVTQTGGTVPGAVLTMEKMGTVTQTTAVSLGASGQDLNLISGVYDLAGFALAVADVLTIGSDAKLICSGGTVSYGVAIVSGEVSCGPTIGITWTGLAGDGLWSTAGNWTNNTIPGVNDIAIFGSKCSGANCNVSMNTTVNVKGVRLQASYAGTITQPAGIAITVGTSGWTQDAGTFVGGDSGVQIVGPFALNGGSYTATTGLSTFRRSVVFAGAPVFVANGGSVELSPSTSVGAVTWQFLGSALNNLTITGVGYGNSFSLNGDVVVNGNLHLTRTDANGYTIAGGTILAKGNVSVSAWGLHSASTVVVRIAGASDQTVTGVAGVQFPTLEIASTGGTVSFVGTVDIQRSFTYISGSVDAGTSTIRFVQPWTMTASVVPGPILFNNVEFRPGLSTTISITGEVVSRGQLVIAATGGSTVTGVIRALGDVEFSGLGLNGSVQIIVAGNSNQSLSAIAGANIPAFEVASTGGTVSLSGVFTFKRNYTYTSGVVSAGTSEIRLAPDNTVSVAVMPGPVAYHAFNFAGGLTSVIDLQGQTVTVNGPLVFSGSATSLSVNNGTVLSYADILATTNGGKGTVQVIASGSANRTISGVAGATLPSLEIATVGGTTTLSGTLDFSRDYRVTSGTVTSGTSTLSFNPLGATAAVIPGVTAYNNVSFPGLTASIYNLTGTMQVNGTLTLNAASTNVAISGGALDARGNVVLSASGIAGSVSLGLSGASSTTLNTASSALYPSSGISVAKSGGASVTLLSNATLAAPRDVSVSSGTLDLNGYALTVGDTLTIEAGATLRCNGGTYTAAFFVKNGTSNCPGESNYDFNWTGAGADNSWTTAENWQGGVAPGAGATVVFKDEYCGATCNSMMTAPVNVRGVQILAPFSGTITQGVGQGVTVGAAGWSQAGGTFIGSNADVTINGGFSHSGGNFQAPSAVVGFQRDVTIGALATFTAGSSTVIFKNKSYGNCNYTYTYSVGSTEFNNVVFDGSEYCAVGASISGNLTVNGALTIQAAPGSVGILHGGNIVAKGNVTLVNNGYRGFAKLKLAGSTSQSLTGGVNASVGELVFESTGGIVSLAGEINVWGPISYTSGVVDAVASHLVLQNVHNASWRACNSTYSWNPGPLVFGDVTMYSDQYCGQRAIITGSFRVGGTLTVNSPAASAGQVDGGTIVALGNVSVLNRGSTGNSAFRFEGSSDRTLNMVTGSSLTNGTVTVAKTGAKVTQISNAQFNAAAQDLTVQSGTLDMAGFNLTVNRNIINNGTLLRGVNPMCGNLSFGGTYSGAAALCP